MSASLEASKPTFATELKKSLFDFINKNIPSANVNAIDDIVLSYVVTIFEEVSDETCFDVDVLRQCSHLEKELGFHRVAGSMNIEHKNIVNGLRNVYSDWESPVTPRAIYQSFYRMHQHRFIEMMGAYVPDFTTIDEGQICTWVLEVEAELVRQQREQKGGKQDEAAANTFDVVMPSLIEMLPPANVKTGRNHSSSESEEEENMEHVVYEGEEYTAQVQVLREMFPNTCVMEIKHCISIADGEIELAAATLLHRLENGQALTGAVLPSPRQSLIDDITLKYRIIERYSYVDKNSGNKEHRPLAPKVEPKKLVRYRDNKVVSLKGEKYTEVSKSGAEEENLKKPKKHCP